MPFGCERYGTIKAFWRPGRSPGGDLYNEARRREAEQGEAAGEEVVTGCGLSKTDVEAEKELGLKPFSADDDDDGEECECVFV